MSSAPSAARRSEGGDLRASVAALRERPGYAVLLDALRDKLEGGGAPATVTLPDLDGDARRALADLLGRRRPPAVAAALRLAEVDAGLRASRVGAGLIEVLEAAGGPLADRRAERAGAQAAWDAVWTFEHPARQRPEVAAWLDALRRAGTLRRLVADPAAATALLAQALAVVDRLPARGVALSVLAGEAVGDPHALDHGRPLATLLARAAARLAGQAPTSAPTSARARRQLWADVGVVCDPLSVSVLVLGLRLAGTDIVATACDDHAGFGVPLRLTLHQLALTTSLRSRQPRVLVCENPAVVAAAAARLSQDAEEPVCPLVCVEGIPDVAADRLLSGLADGGTTLGFHADFDWGGLRIGNLMRRRHDAVPWRFGTADYRRAVAEVAVGGALPRRSGTADWDPALGPALRTTGVAISEEQVLDDLLTDLLP